MAKHVSNTSSMELSHYATILRRRWVYVVSALGVGVLVATALMFVVPSKSTSTTLVNINLISANAFSASRPPSDLLDMETEQAMARSTIVMNEVAAGLGDDWTKSSVRAATEATLLPDGTVLRIQFTGASPQEAADGATLVAEKYLAYRSEEAQGRVDTASERLVTRRDSLRKQLNGANRDVSDTEADSQARLTAELTRQTIAEELTAVTTQLNELRLVTTGGGSVLTEADPQQTQSSPNRPLMLFSGVLGGLLSGLVLAFVVNVLDRRVRDPYDVAGAGGGGTVAQLGGNKTAVPAEGVEAEQIRAVRERVMAATSSERPVIAVIDVGPDDAAPTDVAVNLAASLADSGLATDLIIVDHSVDVLVNVLHDLLAREVGARANVRRFRSRKVPTLQISVPDTSGTRLATIDVVVDLVSSPERTAAVTVVALSPSAGSAARLAAGRFADQVLLAVHELGTHIDELAAVASDLIAVEARLHGTVLLPEGRHLPAHSSVGAGAAFLRSATPSVFTGGAVSGARSSALLDVMEDLVAPMDEPTPDEPTPREESPTDPEMTEEVPRRSLLFQRQNDHELSAAVDTEPEVATEPEPEIEAEAEVEPAVEVQPEPELEGEPEVVEPAAEAVVDETAAEPDVSGDDDPAGDQDAARVDAVALAERTESKDSTEEQISTEDQARTEDHQPAASSEGDSSADSGQHPAVEAVTSGSARASAASGAIKKKRGKGRRPGQSRQAQTPGAGQTVAQRQPSTRSETASARAEQRQADERQSSESQSADDRSAENQSVEDVPPAAATETGEAQRPVIPANENGWAFTR